MNAYSAKSRAVLDTIDPDLRRVFEAVLASDDHTAMRGIRTLEEQLEFVRTGLSKTPCSRHLPGGGLITVRAAEHVPGESSAQAWLRQIEEGNALVIGGLSKALDAAPYINGRISFEHKECAYFAGVVKRVAFDLGIGVRWGGDWDRDRDQSDQTFLDLVHFELR